MTGGISEEEDQSKGPVVHQESKTFDGEFQLLTVFDNPDRKLVTFEAYSLESSDTLALRYNYGEFDQFFRFNAELMNPNNREGRYHWIIKRLVFASDGSSGRKLALGGKPTDEAPEIPVYTQVKIPTGRMNYNERQRLRDEMERLDMRRDENIEKKRIARERKFIAELEEQKTMVALRQTARMEKIAQEKKERYAMIAESHQGDLDKKMELIMLDKERQEVIKEMEERHMAREEEGVKETIEKFRVDREAKQKLMEAAATQKSQIRKEIIDTEEAAATLAEKLEQRREDQWEAREERIGKKEDSYLQFLQRKKEEELRKTEIVEEKRQEAVRTARLAREALFRAQFGTSAERAAYAQATRPKAPGEKVALVELRKKKKKKVKSASTQKNVMDSVHEQMMEHIAQKNIAQALQSQREERQQAVENERNRREYERSLEWQEQKQQAAEAKQEAYRQRKSVKDEKLAEEKADNERRKAERDRLEGLREMRIRDKAAVRAKGA